MCPKESYDLLLLVCEKYQVIHRRIEQKIESAVFGIYAPKLWNALPIDIEKADLLAI